MVHVLHYPDGYGCQYREDYFGLNCEQKYVCSKYSPCYNDGQCRVDSVHYYCECLLNFTSISKQKK